MNVFQKVWSNWTRPLMAHSAPACEHPWINELNQAVFARLQRELPAVKVRAVAAPIFRFYVEAPGGYGVDVVSGMVETKRVRLPKDGTFEQRVDAAISQIKAHINSKRGTATAFFYTPVVPDSKELIDGSPNRHMMCIRMWVTPWEVTDVAGAE